MGQDSTRMLQRLLTVLVPGLTKTRNLPGCYQDVTRSAGMLQGCYKDAWLSVKCWISQAIPENAVNGVAYREECERKKGEGEEGNRNKQVVRASPVSHGPFYGLTVDPMEDDTVHSSPVAPPVFSHAKKTPFSYTASFLHDVFIKENKDVDRAQALYKVFTEMAAELETTSHFTAVMTRHIVNPVPSNTLHLAPCLMQRHAFCHMQNLAFYLTSSSHQNHALSHTTNHAKSCTLILALSHMPSRALYRMWSLALSRTMTFAHSTIFLSNRHPSSPSPAPRQLKRKRFKKKQKAKTTENISDNNDMDYFNNFGSEPEMDLDGFFADPNYDLSVALEEFKNCGGSAEELHKFRLLYEELHSVGGACHIPYRLDDPPNTPSVSLPTRSRDHNMQTHPLPVTQTSSLPTSDPLPPASTSALPIGALAPHRPSYPPHVPKVSLPRAQTEPLPQNSSTTMIPPRAQTAPPDVSRNTLTAQRCTNKDASPSSFVKFMDVPVTMTREHIHDCLQNNRKWSMVDISNVEIFAIKNKDSNVVNVLKIKFKDDAQSTIAKRVLTTSISFGDTISRRCRPWYLSTRSN
ncbi:hypothetical protein JOM56_012713 [Amanita muscaria]